MFVEIQGCTRFWKFVSLFVCFVCLHYGRFLVVPQPVYMNMADAMANVRNAQSEADEGMDLKTPTAEDQTGLGSDSGYAGSGGSGGSQHMEDVAAGNGKHQINRSASFCLFTRLFEVCACF